jgi:hypothetical protein
LIQKAKATLDNETNINQENYSNRLVRVILDLAKDEVRPPRNPENRPPKPGDQTNEENKDDDSDKDKDTDEKGENSELDDNDDSERNDRIL